MTEKQEKERKRDMGTYVFMAEGAYLWPDIKLQTHVSSLTLSGIKSVHV